MSHPPPISPPTRKLKTRPFRTCILASGEFAYLPSCIPHLHNPRNLVRNDRVLGYCFISHQFPLPPENSKHVHYGRVFWLRVSLFTFPHTFPTSTTQETQSEVTGFRVFCLIPPHISSPTRKWKTCLYGTCFLSLDVFVYISPCLPHLHNPKNPVQMARFRVFYLILPLFPLPPENGKHTHMGCVFRLWVTSSTFPHIYPTSTVAEISP